jgi:quaternary ammonium compound-resistance protein SugE
LPLFSASATLLLKKSTGAGSYADMARLVWMGRAAGSYLLGFLCYGQRLVLLDASAAYPVMIALTMATVAVFGTALLGEAVSFSKVAGMCLLCLACWLMTR